MHIGQEDLCTIHDVHRESAVAVLRKGNTKQWKGSGSLGKERSKCAVLTVDFAALFGIYASKTICGRSIEKAAADVAEHRSRIRCPRR